MASSEEHYPFSLRIFWRQDKIEVKEDKIEVKENKMSRPTESQIDETRKGWRIPLHALDLL